MSKTPKDKLRQVHNININQIAKKYGILDGDLIVVEGLRLMEGVKMFSTTNDDIRFYNCVFEKNNRIHYSHNSKLEFEECKLNDIEISGSQFDISFVDDNLNGKVTVKGKMD